MTKWLNDEILSDIVELYLQIKRFQIALDLSFK